jgi:uncharacterized membrane protein YfcA
MTGVEWDIAALLFGVAVVAGCFDAIAGGGGLITVPALILAGLDPVTAIATNKVQGSAGAISATVAFARRGLILWRTALPVALVAVLASMVGALSISRVPTDILSALIPILMIAIAVYFASAPRMRDEDARARMPLLAFTLLIVPLVAFYDGVFGPGAGSFYMVGFVTLLGYGVTRGTAHTKLANAASNVGSLALFALSGDVLWPLGLVMACGAFLGAQAGSALAIRFGARLIRPLLVVISCLMAVRLLSDAENPLRRAVTDMLS